ncbi:Undecaprenyl-phosphate galactose phosphotransferase WbaP [Azospirillum sp. OGB3]|uniref:sugar transferase n=1 Tax=Azospirillum sp. OGB3 TaxID=2587012 RepID=UPI0018594ACB|nr:sugar transferase [Azospirillum sp. OGB3]MBB3265570.1 Undecaprenyl-phosphate galactose phosphotransferase WbaP [Azospirillum sp. OGB3]
MGIPQSIQLGAAPLEPATLAGTASAAELVARLPATEPLHRNRVKRAFDIVGAVGLILFFGPLMLIVGLLITLDGGPAVFGHRRIGTEGRDFTCWKFRSMVVNAPEVFEKLIESDPEARAEWEATRKLRNDPRITWIGRFLRRTSLDELPQLFNVLTGDMSLVGPRPIVQEEVARYHVCFPFYMRCRPGLTGLWQVSGRNDVDYGRRVQLDTAYLLGWSLWGDIRILLRTVGVMLSGKGAY